MKTYIEVDPAVELPKKSGEYVTEYRYEGETMFDIVNYHAEWGSWLTVWCEEIKTSDITFWLKPIDEQEEAQKRCEAALEYYSETHIVGTSGRLQGAFKIAAGLRDKQRLDKS